MSFGCDFNWKLSGFFNKLFNAHLYLYDMNNETKLTLDIVGKWYAGRFQQHYSRGVERVLIDAVYSKFSSLSGEPLNKVSKYINSEFSRGAQIEYARRFFKRQFERSFKRFSYHQIQSLDEFVESIEPFKIFVNNAVKLFDKTLPKVIDGDDLDMEFLKTFESVECFIACYVNFAESANSLLVVEEASKDYPCFNDIKNELYYISAVAQSYPLALRSVFKDLL